MAMAQREAQPEGDSAQIAWPIYVFLRSCHRRSVKGWITFKRQNPTLKQ
jgi:hypothetical protein